jgi:hypothetical protein
VATFMNSDFWLFLAVARSDGAGLGSFIAAADHINCTIPLEEEIAGAISRLRAAALVTEESGAFRLTPFGETIFARGGGLSAAPRSQFLAIERLLADVNLPLSCEPYALDQATYRAAVVQYSKSMRSN